MGDGGSTGRAQIAVRDLDVGIEGRRGMLDTALLASIAQQMMSGNTVDLNGKPVPVGRTSGHRLRTLAFSMDGREYQANSSGTR
jgi:hypothetical protein